MACSAYKWVELVPPNIKFLLSANKSGHSLLPLGGNGQISLQFIQNDAKLSCDWFFSKILAILRYQMVHYQIPTIVPRM